jgi:hypothetical protein
MLRRTRNAILPVGRWLPILFLLICGNASGRADDQRDDAVSDAAWWTPAGSPDACGPQTAGNCVLPGDPLSPVIIENGCENGPGNVDRSPAPQFWYAGVEGTFLHVTHRAPGVDIAEGTYVDPATSEVNSDYGVGPRVWLGIELGDGWGVRGRFWSFRDNADGVFGNPSSAVGMGTGSFAVGDYNLDAYTIDVEATKSWCFGPWYLDASLGARYAEMHQDAFLGFYENVEGTTAFGSAYRRISGTGLTAALEGHYCLGDSGWDLFANARGSILWGSTNGLATAAADDNFGTFGSDVASVSNSTTLSIFEAQVGAEWTRPLKCVCGTFFFRSAVEYQRWNASDAPAAMAGGEVFGHTVETTVTSTTPSPTISLIGLNVAAGFRY